MVRQTTAAREPEPGAADRRTAAGPRELVESYRRLAEVFHLVLSEQSLDALLERIAVTLADLMPYEALHIYEADEEPRELIPVLARSQAYEDEIMSDRPRFGEGITGLGGREPPARLDEPRAPRPARASRPRHADRAGGADQRAADRARRAQGRPQHLPHRRGRAASPSTSSSSRSGSATRPRSRSTTRRSARASSIWRRRTR